MNKVAFVGNFEVPFSTESHMAWTWERMGWEVIRFQENKVSRDQVLFACGDQQTKLFQWTHTHTFPSPNITLDDIQQIRNWGVKSFSYHLDRYWGIGNREGDYLKHPSFLLDYFFSTDGGNEDRWKDAGINHVWLLPGVVEYATHINPPNENIPVLFTGSENYHGEYPWRKHMVNALRENYGNKFQVRTGVREEALNTLYASAKICVGDHIFAGYPRYCSDRLFETIGRGGFIIYPNTIGVTEELEKYGLVVYNPQNILDLFLKIDYFLDTNHETERLERKKSLHDYVKNNHTYTHRLSQILKIMEI